MIYFVSVMNIIPLSILMKILVPLQ